MELNAESEKMKEGEEPDGWFVTRLSDQCDLISKGTTPTSIGRHFSNRGINFIKIESLDDNGQILEEKLAFIDESTHSLLRRSQLSPKDILFSIAGALGRVTLVTEDDLPANTNQALAFIRLRCRAEIDHYYLLHYLNSLEIKRHVESINVQGAQANLSLENIRDFEIKYPNLTEQRAIAAALSDVDALIAALDHLIAKKRDIKQAAMQELLTGKRRLPGFSGEWEKKQLGEITDVDPDSLTCNTSPEYAFKYISIEDVEAGILKGYSEMVYHSAPSRARRKVKKNDILFSTVRPNLKSHLLLKDDVFDLICSTGFSVLRCKQGISEPIYVYFQLFANDIERQIESLIAGSNYPAINGSDVKALRIPLPPPSEQRAIASVISEMDSEIIAMKARYDKTRALKQGMMQELLTGRIRLVRGAEA